MGAGQPAASSIEEQIVEKKRQIKKLKAASARQSREGDHKMLEDRMWLLDTGCPVDLVQTNSLTSTEMERRERAEHPVALETANDRVEADQIVPMQVDGIHENI